MKQSIKQYRNINGKHQNANHHETKNLNQIKSDRYEGIRTQWDNFNDELLSIIVEERCLIRARAYIAMSDEGKRQMELIVQNKFKSN